MKIDITAVISSPDCSSLNCASKDSIADKLELLFADVIKKIRNGETAGKRTDDESSIVFRTFSTPVPDEIGEHQCKICGGWLRTVQPDGAILCSSDYFCKEDYCLSCIEERCACTPCSKCGVADPDTEYCKYKAAKERMEEIFASEECEYFD